MARNFDTIPFCTEHKDEFVHIHVQAQDNTERFVQRSQDVAQSDKKQLVTDKESVDKLVKNASKQATSASLTGGKGSREIHISEDMDPEEAARVWDKIPREIRHKILKKLK